MINDFALRAVKAELDGWDEDQLKERLGIFKGYETEGEMEAGQRVGLIKDIPMVKELLVRLVREMEAVKKKLPI